MSHFTLEHQPQGIIRMLPTSRLVADIRHILPDARVLWMKKWVEPSAHDQSGVYDHLDESLVTTVIALEEVTADVPELDTTSVDALDEILRFDALQREVYDGVKACMVERYGLRSGTVGFYCVDAIAVFGPHGPMVRFFLRVADGNQKVTLSIRK